MRAIGVPREHELVILNAACANRAQRTRMERWTGAINVNVAVTGGAGFLGSVLCQELQQRGCRQIAIPLLEEYDLRASRERFAGIRLSLMDSHADAWTRAVLQSCWIGEQTLLSKMALSGPSSGIDEISPDAPPEQRAATFGCQW